MATKARPNWIVNPLIVWMSFQLAIPGGVLSSMARFRFTSQRYADNQKPNNRSRRKQRMAKSWVNQLPQPRGPLHIVFAHKT